VGSFGSPTSLAVLELRPHDDFTVTTIAPNPDGSVRANTKSLGEARGLRHFWLDAVEHRAA
jgi:hypothetical protein